MIGYLLILVIAAITPAVFIIYKIAKADQIEKEPKDLLFRLFFFGVLSTLPAVLLEDLGSSFLAIFFTNETVLYNILLAFLVVGAAEEGSKYFFLHYKTWRNPNFNYRFDAVVYSVCISLGFAAFENILYLLRGGLSLAFSRGILSIPSHACDAVVMGYFYGRAKLFDSPQTQNKMKRNQIYALLSAIALHGFYDAVLFISSPVSMIVFIAFVITMYITIYRLIKKESNTDQQVA